MLDWFKKKKNSGDAAVSQIPAEPVSGVNKENSTAAVLESQPGRPEEQKGLFLRLQERLSKTRDTLVSRVDELFLGRKEIDAQLLDELEEILITADLGVNTAIDLIDGIRGRVSRQELKDSQALKLALKERILAFFAGYDAAAALQMPDTGPLVIMVVGVNGVGKTTTIGKIANKFVRSGSSVLLVAGDTFRAAAIDQLKIWGERVGVDVVAKQQGADPSSVIYDAMDYAAARDFDVIIIDTAGRLHTKVNLMEELKKIKRVIGNKLAGAPHEIMLVLDATTGQNSISQARLFNETIGITGLVLTKLDGTAKGGIVVNICHDFNIPIRFIGIGEKLDDLRDFDPQEFVEALFANRSED
jgi:fused signal recognition particle receptor